MRTMTKRANCFNCPRINLVMWMTCFVLGWAIFITAAINASLRTVSHPFVGYEFAGPLLISVALFPLLRLPRRRDAEDWGGDEKYEDILTVVGGIVLFLSVGGFLFCALVAWFEWYAPPDHRVTINYHDSRGIFSSPSPSPSPKPKTMMVPTESDNTVGTLMLLCGVTLAMSNYFGWTFKTGPSIAELIRGEAGQGLGSLDDQF